MLTPEQERRLVDRLEDMYRDEEEGIVAKILSQIRTEYSVETEIITAQIGDRRITIDVARLLES